MNDNRFYISSEIDDKVLSEDELRDLFRRMNSGEKECRELILKSNIKLVYFVCNSEFKNLDSYYEDLISVGLIGLFKAIQTFKLDYNIKFATYAYRCIKNEILINRKNVRV